MLLSSLFFSFSWLLEYSTQVLYGNEPFVHFLKAMTRAFLHILASLFTLMSQVTSAVLCRVIFFSIAVENPGWLFTTLCICFIMSLRLWVLSSFSSQHEKLQFHHARNKTPCFHSYPWTEFLIKWKWSSLSGSTLITNNVLHLYVTLEQGMHFRRKVTFIFVFISVFLGGIWSPYNPTCILALYPLSFVRFVHSRSE